MLRPPFKILFATEVTALFLTAYRSVATVWLGCDMAYCLLLYNKLL